MTPFIMNEDVEGVLGELSELSASDARVISLETLRQYSDSGFDPEDPSTRTESPYPMDQTVELPLGWKVTLTHEHQPQGLCRHMSMSSPAPGRVPHPVTIQWTMKALGFHGDVRECDVYMEHYQEGRVAVNVIELIDAGPTF